jgi:CheY-like chemotaxis protein
MYNGPELRARGKQCEMDGYSATRAIRGLASPKGSVAIIALTADAMEQDKQRCLEAGMNNFIPKPFRLDEIGKVVQSYLIYTLNGFPVLGFFIEYLSQLLL